ncbi:uncharacterized protein LOC143270126 isoform X3 [Peromyscus maniculatus bairdii]|uniref:uncharacterized protein LOC143270126 isoform X3 n=1 Tax=Peromyscus maniculatus bairdii TaxID=230844 RepID=UPI003FD38936
MNFLGDPEVKGVTRVTKEKRVFLDFLECWGRKSLSDPASGSRSCLPEDQTNTPCRTLGHTCQKTRMGKPKISWILSYPKALDPANGTSSKEAMKLNYSITSCRTWELWTCMSLEQHSRAGPVDVGLSELELRTVQALAVIQHTLWRQLSAVYQPSGDGPAHRFHVGDFVYVCRHQH